MLALQVLYALDVGRNTAKLSRDWPTDGEEVPDKAISLGESLIRGVTERLPELDRIIQRYAPAWPVNQLSPVDRNILRLALLELMYSDNTPKKTAINEAVELGKVFGSESSARFVNGVLGSAMIGLEMGELAPDKTV